MTVAADLATLRFCISDIEEEGLAALDRVEAELARLREERDAARVGNRLVAEGQNELMEALSAAEARCARLQQAILTSYVCEECGRLGLITEFGDDCKPGWTHGRLVKVKSVGEALAAPDTPADSKGFSEEACVRCGWRMGQSALNCQNDDTPHRFPSQDTPADSQEDEWFIPEGDRQCGVVHKMARATCMKRRGHDGSHATPQGTWIDGPWCEYPADSQENQT